ncbi:hypothetical protein [Flavobacterium eburneipallidum]|uniref:hypothetical protein n=1 Tax=Flavobacterium eburneipallidum TaxID=3003263 RepID=UPI00248253CB|nr:hypothetical protein [Flavobacterium eburneipallidum]
MKNKLNLMLILFSSLLSYSQDLPTIIPPSPNAASLGQYADVPVSNYTGVPNISIPLFNIKSGAIELPVTLSYHASGIKVAQEASLVGLGWALNAGGVITRQVRGFDDFKPNGYINTPVPPYTANNLPYNPSDNPLKYYNEYYLYLNSTDRVHRIDGEPDIFYYNFFGYSGQLLFEQQNYSNAVSVDQNNLKFSFDNNEWIITDGNGWKYYFGNHNLYATENTTDYDYSTDGPITSNPYLLESRNIMPYDSFTDTTDTAWYITKAITPQGDKIEFIYSNNSTYKTLSNITYSERLMQLVDVDMISTNGGPDIQVPMLPSGNQHESIFSQQVVQDVYLKKIVFKNGYIDFNTEDRDDLRRYGNYSYILNPQKIKSAELFDLNNNSIKKINFNYSYFNESIIQSNPEHKEDFLRLRLDSIVESFKEKNSATYSSHSPYTFTYNTIPLPDKLSFSVDYWGYYNGQNNQNINLNYYRYQDSNEYGGGINNSNNFVNAGTPKAMLSPSYINLNSNDIAYFGGANRDVNPSFVQTAILEKISYPTGASVNFNYSPNTYYAPDIYDTQSVDFFVLDYFDYEVSPQDKQANFTTSEPILFFMNFEVYKDNYNTQTSFNGEAALKDSNGNKVLYLNSNLEFDEWGRFQTTRSIVLKPGTYTLHVNKGDSFTDVTISAFYYKKISANKKYGAGLRIDSITNIDKENAIKKKKYSYEIDSISTGKMLSPIKYWYNKQVISSINSGLGSNETNNVFLANYVIRTSETIRPLGYSAQGKNIGYDQVSTSDADLNNNILGSSQYFYENINEIPAEYFIPGIPNRINLSNGQLLKEIHANKNGNIVNEKEYLYETNNSNRITIKGVKRFDILDYGINLPSIEIRFYDVNSEWRYLKSVTEKIYNINGNNPVTTTTNYKYENATHKNLTETQTTNSEGKQIITTNQYPSDYPTNTGMTANDFDVMISKNILNPVIKQQTKVNSNLLATQVSKYKNWNLDINGDNVPDNIFLPENVKTAKGTNSPENRIQYHSYYPNGNVQEVSKFDGTHIVYIWGYKDEYPIAMIENATYTEVSSYVSDLQTKSNLDTDNCLDSQSCNEKNLRTALNSLRNDATYKDKWQVSTYTYNPLIGVTSMTDSKGNIIYYNYDSFNRLQNVKDKDGNILSENEYHYKN